LALEQGFTGIGVSQKGAIRFIHVDDLPDAPGQPRPTIWSY
jgi:zinc D-Ala-D-Ala carboxypeptidase